MKSVVESSSDGFGTESALPLLDALKQCTTLNILVPVRV